MSALSLPYCIESAASSSKSATLPRRHRRQLSNDSTYVTSREHSPSLRYRSSSHASSTLPRNTNNIRSPLHASSKSRESSRKTSRSSLATTKTADITIKREPSSNKDTPKLSSAESLKTSHTNHQEYDNDKNAEIEQADGGHLKSLINIDNSGPSSIESHKSSKTGSSLTSGPSSLESHKTVISRTPTVIPATDKSKKSPKRRDSLKQRAKISPLNLSSSNSFTLQVTTNQNGGSYTSGTNASASATINSGTGTKIYVQNSPVRSVITFENGQNHDPNPNLVIINANANEQQAKNTNNDGALNNSRDTINNEHVVKQETMNNSRKLSLQMPQRDSLNFRNVIKNVPDSPITVNGFREFTKNSFDSNPPSPTKAYDSLGGSASNVYSKNLTDSISSLDKSYNSILDLGNKLVEKNILGSEPNISCNKETDKNNPQQLQAIRDQFPSLSDLSFNFTSLAAQKILKGVSINSIDTLVELNMAANGEKQNNCDVVHTDFGLV